MSKNILTLELTWKSAFLVVGALLASAGVFYGGVIAYRHWQARPKSAAAVKEQIFAFLKKKSGAKDFKVELALDTSHELGAATNDLSQLRAQVQALQGKIAGLQAEVRTNRDEVSALNSELRRMKRVAGILQAKRRMKPEVASTNASATVVTATATTDTLEATNQFFDLASAAQTNATLKPILEKDQQLTAMQAKVSAKQKELQGLYANLNTAQKNVMAKQREVNALQNGTAGQGKVVKEMQQQLQNAVTWEALYKALGQELWIVDTLLSQTNMALRQSGLQLADQARAQASNSGESDWLAARICECFICPNIDLADAAGRGGSSRDQLLTTVGITFRQAGETNNFIKNCELLIQTTSNAVRADYTRSQLAYAYEMMGDYENILKTLPRYSNQQQHGVCGATHPHCRKQT